MSDIRDAIARAQGDVAFLEKEWDHDCDCPDDPGFRGAHGKDCPWMRWVNGEDDARDRLARLGPASVALAVALELAHRAFRKCLRPTTCQACDALQDWADAQQGV